MGIFDCGNLVTRLEKFCCLPPPLLQFRQPLLLVVLEVAVGYANEQRSDDQLALATA